MRIFLNSIFLVSVFSFAFCLNSGAQDLENDMRLIETHRFTKNMYHKREVKFITSSVKNPFLKYNPVTIGLGSMMYIYQKVISRQLSAGCPYEISCSNFSVRCIRHYGVVKGMALTADRLMRCNNIAAPDINILFFQNNKIIDPPENYTLRP